MGKYLALFRYEMRTSSEVKSRLLRASTNPMDAWAAPATTTKSSSRP
jgi:hypothetical protein